MKLRQIDSVLSIPPAYSIQIPKPKMTKTRQIAAVLSVPPHLFLSRIKPRRSASLVGTPDDLHGHVLLPLLNSSLPFRRHLIPRRRRSRRLFLTEQHGLARGRSALTPGHLHPFYSHSPSPEQHINTILLVPAAHSSQSPPARITQTQRFHTALFPTPRLSCSDSSVDGGVTWREPQQPARACSSHSVELKHVNSPPLYCLPCSDRIKRSGSTSPHPPMISWQAMLAPSLPQSRNCIFQPHFTSLVSQYHLQALRQLPTFTFNITLLFYSFLLRRWL